MVLRTVEQGESTRTRARFDRGAGVLVASRCQVCEATSWPARAICSACGGVLLEAVHLPEVGTLVSYTTVWVPRGALPAPYVLGQVDYGHGATVFAHVRELPDGATVPLPARVVLADDPDVVPSFWFEPA
jgi:uncharacterized protein